MRREIPIGAVAGSLFVVVWLVLILVFLTPLFGVDFGVKLWETYGKKMYFYLTLLGLAGFFFGGVIGTSGTLGKRLTRGARFVTKEMPYSFFALLLSLAVLTGVIGGASIYLLYVNMDQIISIELSFVAFILFLIVFLIFLFGGLIVGLVVGRAVRRTALGGLLGMLTGIVLFGIILWVLSLTVMLV